MPTQQSAGRFKIQIDGRDLPEDVEDRLTEAVVDGNLNQPDMFVLSFRDQNRVVLEKTGAKIGSKVTVNAVSSLIDGPTPLLAGDVTAIEAHQDAAGTYTVMRGYDESHRLYRGTNTDSYQNMTSSDIAKKVCQRAGLQPGQIDSTDQVYDYVAQNNESDMAFLGRLAQGVGYLVTVVDGKLNFCAPPQSSGGPSEGSLDSGSDAAGALVMGQHILRMRTGVTSADQVSQVQVRGWDPDKKQAVVSSASPTASNADIGTTPGQVAGTFGSRSVTGSNVPYSSQGDVDAAAKAAADHLGGGLAEVHCVARGNPTLKAGGLVSLNLVGDPFDGKYTLTQVRHAYEAGGDGYTTAFSVTGKNQRSVLGLSSGGGGGASGSGGGPAPGPAPVAGVVPALVTDVADPKNQGRIKVKFPSLSDSFNSDWVRMVQFGAGKNRGAVFLPEVGDEVLVAFDHGDWRMPYVIGSLYNGVDTPKLGNDLTDGTSGAVRRRGVISKDGHALVFFDDSSKDGVALMTGKAVDKGEGLSISLNESTTTVTITSAGEIKIQGKGTITISSDADISIEAKQDLSLKGQSVSVNGDSSVKIHSGADVSVSGTPIKLN